MIRRVSPGRSGSRHDVDDHRNIDGGPCYLPPGNHLDDDLRVEATDQLSSIPHLSKLFHHVDVMDHASLSD